MEEKFEKLQKEDEVGPYDKILEWFFKDNELFLEDTLSNREYQDSLSLIPGIDEVLNSNLNNLTKEDRYFMMEFLLWGLEANKKLNKYRSKEFSILEIGTYTGYSAICMARGLQAGGKLTTIDVNEELQDICNKLNIQCINF